MPTRAPRSCQHCHRPVTGRCPCRPPPKPKWKPTPRHEYSHLYGWDWQKFRLHFLAEHPCCAWCEAEGKTTAATLVDHIIPHRGDPALFWKDGNYQSLCEGCHLLKTLGGE